MNDAASARVRIPVRATFSEVNAVLRACEELEREPDAVVLDATTTTMFGPLCVCLLAASTAERHASARSTRLDPPTDKEAARFLREIQFDRFVRGSATDASSTITIRQLRALDPTYTAQAAQVICDGVPGLDEASAYPVQLCLNELLQNVFEWAESAIGCVVLTRWFHKSRSVRLAVVDRGIGIPARLRRLRIADLHRESDADVIVAAVTRPKLSSRVGRAGGLGLKTVHEVVTGRGGRLTVLSYNAKLAWSGSKSVTISRIPAFRGTAIEIDFRPATPVEDPDAYLPVF
jgi:hypothetical protein